MDNICSTCKHAKEISSGRTGMCFVDCDATHLGQIRGITMSREKLFDCVDWEICNTGYKEAKDEPNI